MKIKVSIQIIFKIMIIVLMIIYLPSYSHQNVKVFKAISTTEALQTSVPVTSSKKIHLYNTHQGEEYVGYNVKEGASYLKDCLTKEGYFCDVEQKNRYCLISSIISFFVMEIMQTYDLFGNEMAYVLAITNFVIVSIVKKEVKFYNFIPCILFTWISVFTSTIVLFFFKIITNYDMTKILKLYRLPIIFLARIIFLVLIVVLNYFKTKIKDTIIEKNKYLLTITMVLIFGIYFILLNDIGHMQITIDDIYVVLLLLLVLFFVVCILFIHMTRLYNEKTEYVLKNKELEYIEKNKSLVYYLHDNVMKIQHSLRYGLILIENNIDDQKYEDAKSQVEHFYDLLDEKTNIMTNNYIFDTLLNDYIFLIKSQFDIKVKLLINIGNDSFFKDFNN